MKKSRIQKPGVREPEEKKIVKVVSASSFWLLDSDSCQLLFSIPAFQRRTEYLDSVRGKMRTPAGIPLRLILLTPVRMSFAVME